MLHILYIHYDYIQNVGQFTVFAKSTCCFCIIFVIYCNVCAAFAKDQSLFAVFDKIN